MTAQLTPTRAELLAEDEELLRQPPASGLPLPDLEHDSVVRWEE